MNQYYPPRSFWKEAKLRNKELFAQGMEITPTELPGVTLHAKEVIWTPAGNEEENTPLVWQARYIGEHAIIGAGLHIGEYVKSEVSSDYGLLEHYISYSTQLRMMRVGILMRPGISEELLAENTQEKHSHKNDWPGITKEDCELLITELRRGASGDFTTNPHM